MLVSSRTAVKGEHGFEIAVRMVNLRAGTGARYKNNAHCLRSMHSRSSLFSVVFMCLISPTQKFRLQKSIFQFNFSELGFNCFTFAQ